MEHDREKNTVKVYLTGELDHFSAQKIKRELELLLQDPSVKTLILDMKDMTFMDSSGIGVILGRYREIKSRGGTVEVRNMNPQVKKVFMLSGMNQIIKTI